MKTSGTYGPSCGKHQPWFVARAQNQSSIAAITIVFTKKADFAPLTTSLSEPKLGFWFLVFRKNKNQNLTFAFCFSKNQKAKKQKLGIIYSCCLFSKYKKQKQKPDFGILVFCFFNNNICFKEATLEISSSLFNSKCCSAPL